MNFETPNLVLETFLRVLLQKLLKDKSVLAPRDLSETGRKLPQLQLQLVQSFREAAATSCGRWEMKEEAETK